MRHFPNCASGAISLSWIGFDDLQCAQDARSRRQSAIPAAVGLRFHFYGESNVVKPEDVQREVRHPDVAVITAFVGGDRADASCGREFDALPGERAPVSGCWGMRPRRTAWIS